jgi:hypothetical protein
MLAVGRPMAPPRPYPSHDAFSMLPLSHRSFTTPHISPLCCRPWTKNPVERDLTPGRRTVGGAPLCVWGGGVGPACRGPAPSASRERAEGGRACGRPPPRGAHRRLGRSSSWLSSVPHPRRDIVVTLPLSSPQAL